MPFSPLDIAGCLYWFDATDGATLFKDSGGTVPATSNNDFVGLWKNKAVTDDDAIQTDQVKRARLRTGVMGGLNALFFAGSGNVLGLKYADGSVVPNMTVFLALQLIPNAPTLDDWCPLILGGDGNEEFCYFLFETRGSHSGNSESSGEPSQNVVDLAGGYDYDTRGTLDHVADWERTKLWCATLPPNHGDWELFSNGVPASMEDLKPSSTDHEIKPGNSTGTDMGGLGGCPFYPIFARCLIGEVIVYNSILDEEERDEVFEYLQRWQPSEGSMSFSSTSSSGLSSSSSSGSSSSSSSSSPALSSDSSSSSQSSESSGGSSLSSSHSSSSNSSSSSSHSSSSSSSSSGSSLSESSVSPSSESSTSSASDESSGSSPSEASSPSEPSSSSSCEPDLKVRGVPDPETAKCQECGCSCGGEANVCAKSGSAQIKQSGVQCSCGGSGLTYLSRILKDGIPSTLDGDNGTNWIASAQPYLSLNSTSDNLIHVIIDPCTQSLFLEEVGSYSQVNGLGWEMSFDETACEFRVADCAGNLWFFDEEGDFLRADLRGGIHSQVHRNAQGQVASIDRSVVQDGQTITDSLVYTYFTSGPNAGQVQSVTSQRSTNPTAGIRRMVYTYYEDGDLHGSTGDLQTATEQLLAGTTWVDHETSYYRYCTAASAIGFQHGMKYALGPQALARLQADPQVSDPFQASDAQVARYADQYYEYNAAHRVTKSVTMAGLMTYLFAYTENSSASSESSSSSSGSGLADLANRWTLKIVETRPDGSTVTRYNNHLGQLLLSDLALGADHWLEYHEYNEVYRETLHAHPSAVESYDEGEPDLAVVLHTAAGLIETTTYYDTTDADETTPGGVEGYAESRFVQQGTGGTPVPQSLVEYIVRTVDEVSIYPTAVSTVYRDEGAVGPITTQYDYTWFDDSFQVQQRITTLPVVPVLQNGTGTVDTTTEIMDEYGHLVWRRDARGFITYRAYDLPTGSLIQEIQDVDGEKLTLPDGWTTPAGGGLHLVNDFEVDALGRTTQSLGPTHVVLGQSVRTAGWTVYRDLEDEVLTGQGYALGIGPEYDFTLINPVTIQQVSHDGRVSQSITAVRRCQADASCSCQADDAGQVESAGRLSSGDCFPQSSWIRWSISFTNDQGQTVSSRTYHHIPAEGSGQLGINFDETLLGYDVMNRQNRVVSPTGTISRTVFDVRNLTTATWLGTDDRYATDFDPTGNGATGNNMVQITGLEYDDGSDGGDGNLTQETEFVDSSTTRVTAFVYDFRNRRTDTDGEIDYYEQYSYDNLNHVIEVQRRDTTSGGNLIAQSETRFDDRGRVYQALRFAVDPSDGSVGNSLVDNTWYDANNNILCSLPSGSQAFVKTVFDGIGRPTMRYAGYNPNAEIDPSSVASDIVFEQVETEYDAASNVLFTISRQRWDNATGTGPLQGPSGSEPKSRDTFVAMWHDGVGRTHASANYGTNDNAGPPTRPEEPPESTDDVLVARTRYNERSEAFETTDPVGTVNRSYADDAGRTVRTIQNFVAASDPACFCPGSDQNVVTEMVYGPGEQLRELVAFNPDTGKQITRYEHGATLGESDVASGNLLRAEVYPDAVDSADRVTFAWNRRQQRKRMRDQNGSIHDYAYDGLGRQTADIISMLASGVDGAVRRIGQSYEVRGMVEKITSYSDVSGTTAVNEVQNVYNNFAQLAEQYQEHDGEVNTGTTLQVEYGYADGSANAIRQTSMTYPDGRILEYLYDDADADNLSRICTLRWDGQNVCRYAYLGLNTFVTVQYLEPGIEYNLATGSDANRYAGLDRYDRIIELLWQHLDGSSSNSSSSSSSSDSGPGDALVHLKYGYDRAGNRTFRQDLVAQSYDKNFDELYEYDGLHRLKKFHRGRLFNNNTAIESPTLQQGWVLDSTGNWRNFTQNDQQDADQTLDQQRLHNRVNEITKIARTVGAAWATPQYDRNGNMTVIPQPKDMTTTYRGTWDAWNRLVKLEEPDGNTGWQTLQENAYDGQTWRTVRKEYADGTLSESRHFYYTAAWQAVEERLGPATTDPDRQFVWGLRYIDDLVLRDRTATDLLDERLYAQQDGNWNVVAVCHGTGAVAERYGYFPYGVTLIFDSSWISERVSSVFDNSTLFTGRQIERSTLLYDFRHRWHHPTLGTLTSPDPLSLDTGEINLYRYVFNNPIVLTDPFGLRGGITIPPGTAVRPNTSQPPGLRPGLRPNPGTPSTGAPPRGGLTTLPVPRQLPAHFSHWIWDSEKSTFTPVTIYDYTQLPPGYPQGKGPALQPAPGTKAWEDYARRCWDEYERYKECLRLFRAKDNVNVRIQGWQYETDEELLAGMCEAILNEILLRNRYLDLKCDYLIYRWDPTKTYVPAQAEKEHRAVVPSREKEHRDCLDRLRAIQKGNRRRGR